MPGHSLADLALQLHQDPRDVVLDLCERFGNGPEVDPFLPHRGRHAYVPAPRAGHGRLGWQRATARPGVCAAASAPFWDLPSCPRSVCPRCASTSTGGGDRAYDRPSRGEARHPGQGRSDGRSRRRPRRSSIRQRSSTARASWTHASRRSASGMSWSRASMSYATASRRGRDRVASCAPTEGRRGHALTTHHDGGLDGQGHAPAGRAAIALGPCAGRLEPVRWLLPAADYGASRVSPRSQPALVRDVRGIDGHLIGTTWQDVHVSGAVASAAGPGCVGDHRCHRMAGASDGHVRSRACLHRERGRRPGQSGVGRLYARHRRTWRSSCVQTPRKRCARLTMPWLARSDACR